MEVKNVTDKTIESGKKPTGLKLVGVDTDQMREQAKATEQEVWDFSEGAETQWLTAAKSAITRETEENRFTDVGSIILIISQIATYILVVAEIACLAYITTLEPISILDNIAKYKGLFLACSAFFMVDAIVVNVIVEAKFSLLLAAWLLPFLYPGMRQLHVKGNMGIGVGISVIYFLSLCGFLAFASSQVMYYGKILKIENKSKRQMVAELFDQPTEKGGTIGKQFAKCFSIDEATIDQKGGNTILMVSGNGLIYYSNDTLIRGVSKSIPTKLVFVRENNSVKYKISKVTVKDIELTEIGVEDYWKEMIK